MILDHDACAVAPTQRHDWQRDPHQPGEGLRCTWCLATEAEMEGDDNES